METLPDLPPVERLSPRVIRILGGNPSKFTLQGTNTYLIGTGSSRLLLDTGEGKPVWRTSLQETLQTEKASLSHIILTHWHPDHVGGVRDALSLAPEAKVYKHQPDAGQTDFSDGEVFETEGARIRAFHSPGHTADHMAFILQEEDAMFTGDNVLGHGTAVFEDLAAYMDSLSRMKGEFTGRAYPAHGEVIEDGVGKIEEYIAHRRQREAEALEVLRDGKGWTAGEMVKVIYKGYPEALHGPAEGSLKHVLRKLEGEGKVREGGDGRWALAEKAAL